MNKHVVASFFANYRFLPDWNVFSAAQRKLFTKDVVVVIHDHRGHRVGIGLGFYLEEVREQVGALEPDSDRMIEQFDTSLDQITVRIRGTIRLRSPVNGVAEYADDRHLWTETFRFDADGKIIQLEDRLILKQPG